MKKGETDGAEAAVGCLLMIGLVPVTVLMKGWTVQCLWAWFAVPLGVPAVGFWLATGVGLLASALAGRAGKRPDPDESPMQAVFWAAMNAVVYPLVLLGLGLVCRAAMTAGY